MTTQYDELLRRGHLAEARRLAKAALTEHPGQREALLVLAKLATFDGDFSNAAALAARATLDGVEDVSSLLVKAAIAAQAEDNPEEAKNLYEKAIALAKPPRAEAHFGLGMVLASTGRFSEARGQLERAVQLEPSVGQFHFHLARILLADQRLAEGLPHLEKAVELNPLYPPVYEACCFVLQELGEVAAAERMLREGLKLMPNHPFLLGLLSNVLVAQGQVAEAMQVAQSLAAQHPNDSNVLCNYARLLMATGHQAAALELVQQLRLRGKATHQSHALEGQLLDVREPTDAQAALAAFAAAAKGDDRDWSSLNNLGHLLMRSEQNEAQNLEAAGSVLAESARRAPHRLEPLLNLALVYARQKREEEAKRVARAIVSRAGPGQADLKSQAERLLATLKGK